MIRYLIRVVFKMTNEMSWVEMSDTTISEKCIFLDKNIQYFFGILLYTPQTVFVGGIWFSRLPILMSIHPFIYYVLVSASSLAK